MRRFMGVIGDQLRLAFGLSPNLPHSWHLLLEKIAADGDTFEDQRFGEDLIALLPRLRRFAHRLGCRPEEVDDLVQETLARAWKYRRRFEPGTNLQAWASTLMRNLRRSSTRRLKFVGEYDEGVSELILAQGETQSAAAELSYVREGIQALSEDHRIALEMIALHGLSYEAAAEALGLPVGTLKSRVSRARSSLKSAMTSGRYRRVSEAPGLQPVPPSQDVGTPELTTSETPTSDPPISLGRGAWALAKSEGRRLIIG